MRIVQLMEGPQLGFGPQVARKSVSGATVMAEHTFEATGLWCLDSDGMVYAQVRRLWDGDTKTLFWYHVPSQVVRE